MKKYPSAVAERQLYSFDQTESVRGMLARPDRYHEVEAWFSSDHTLIPRGSGLNYALSSAASGSVSISTACFNRILSFSPGESTITVEAGLRVGELLAFLKERGFWFPVIPGHPTITLGGCLGANIHGKSQFQHGNFSEHVESFVLLDDAGHYRSCSRTEHAELFGLTFGAFGLTGLVVEMTLRIRPLQGSSLTRTRIRARDLIESAELMMAHKESFDQTYSWNDLNRTGRSFGSGYVYLEAFSPDALPDDFSITTIEHPFRGLWPLLNGRASCLSSHAYRVLEGLKPDILKSGLLTGAFPFNKKEFYYKMFGARGFREYQCLIPAANWNEFVSRVSRLRQRFSIDVTLGSLKIFRGARHYLWFSGDGICLALDVPAAQESVSFFTALDDAVGSMGGIVNIAKDSRLEAKYIAGIFPQYHEFRDLLRKYTPRRKFASALQERLDV